MTGVLLILFLGGMLLQKNEPLVVTGSTEQNSCETFAKKKGGGFSVGNAVLFGNRNGQLIAMLQKNTHPLEGDVVEYSIHMLPSISADDAELFFIKSLEYCLLKEKNPFCLCYRLYDSPEWGSSHLRYCEKWMKNRGRKVDFDSLSYHHERLAIADYLHGIMNEHSILNIATDIIIYDLYIDCIQGDKVIVGDVYLKFFPNQRH